MIRLLNCLGVGLGLGLGLELVGWGLLFGISELECCLVKCIYCGNVSFGALDGKISAFSLFYFVVVVFATLCRKSE